MLVPSPVLIVVSIAVSIALPILVLIAVPIPVPEVLCLVLFEGLSGKLEAITAEGGNNGRNYYGAWA